MQDFSEWPLPAKALAGLFAAVLVAALWSILASVVFLAGTGLLAKHEGLILADWWLYLWFYGINHQPVVGFWLKLSAGVVTGVPLLLVAVGLLRKGLPGSSRELHGVTQWERNGALRKEFRARFAGLYIGHTGMGLYGRRRYLRFGGPEHVACYAPTRSGKGVGLVIPNCLLYEGSLVCLDVKKENFAASAGIRAKAGQKVFLFDPLAPDGRTARYNPLSYVRRGTLDAFDDIQRISQMLFPHSEGDQAFWTNSARSAFVGATSFLAETPELPLTIGEVLRLLSRHDGAPYILKMVEARRTAGNPYSAATVNSLSDYLSGSTDTVQGIRKTMTASLSLWFNPRVDAATSESDFDLRELRNSLHAVYVGVSPDNIERLRPLLALFFQQLVDLTVRTLPQFDPKAKHQVLVLLDEFPLLGPMPVLANAFAFVAGYNMRLMLIMQSKAQLRDPALYGPDKAAAMLDNCGVEVVFGTKDLVLSKELSERLGYDTVDGVSRSGPRFWRPFRGKNLNETESDQRRALLLPQEVMRLKPRDAIVIRPGMFPIKAKRIRYFEDTFFKRLLLDPPEVTPIEVVQLMDQGTVGPAPATPPAAAPAAVAVTPAAPAPAVAPATPAAASVPPATTTVVSATPVPNTAEPSADAKGKAVKGKGKAATADADAKVPVSSIEFVKLRYTTPDFAFADVQLAGVNLRGLRVTRKDGVVTIRPPEQADGQGKPRPLYTIRPEWQDAIAARITELWEHADDGEAKAAGSSEIEAVYPAPAAAGVAAAPAVPTPEVGAEASPAPGLSPTGADSSEEPAEVAEVAASAPVVEAPSLRPFQSDGLIAGMMGVDVDLSQFVMKDGKAKFASILDGVPTVESLNRGRGIAAE